mmetsp:Transcript_21954/g.50595  ORF Transcript_21954/g.50595 Transcript_21954/m.50595 type:complete len:280 (+) Transcript_21954:67-906(+)
MARNAEKANGLLNKWVTMKKEFNSGGPAERRPYMTKDCDDLGQAEKWRGDVIREMSKKINEIQNAGLGEHKIRDLNDQINKLIREKRHWQTRIMELGGANYNGMEPKSYDADGRELPGSGGYKYFGAAKELPGVRELFQAEAPAPPRRTRGDMFKNITPDYYGYRDEDDGVLVRKEAAAEKRGIAEEVERHEEAKKQRLDDRLASGVADAIEPESSEDEEEAGVPGDEDGTMFGQAEAQAASATTSAALKAHVPVPNQEEIKGAILDYRKDQLLAQFLS